MKKGFTLVELLAVIAILGFILFIAFLKLNDVLQNSKDDAFRKNQANIVRAAKNYFTLNYELLPKNNGNFVEISLDTLKSEKYVQNLVDPNDGSPCGGYIIVKKIEDKLVYTPNIRCDSVINSSATDNTVLNYTFDDFQEPTVNLIPGGIVNSYPGVGNTHGTYNTSQYNGAAAFSIGTISSVSNNVVTLSTVTRPIYTYDVLTPQTTGGGVTAGTRYFIKKLSATSFTLHPYDSVQDGSKGYAVHSSIYNDTRINIDATGFPTMWLGPPHLPNSGLVKEIIPNCFNSQKGSLHECIRLHTNHRSEGEAEQMAYGVYPAVTLGRVYTFSYYYRGLDDFTVGKTIGMSMHTSAGWPNSVTNTIASKNVWYRSILTSTAPATGGTNLYFAQSKMAEVDLSELQVEEKPYVTPYTTGTRNGRISDYSANNNFADLVLTTTPRWINKSYLFDGIDDVIQSTNPITITGNQTISAWINPSSTTSLKGIAAFHNHSLTSNLGLNIMDGKLSVSIGYTDATREYNLKQSIKSIPLNTWTHVALSYNSTTNKIYFYINGTLDSQHTITKTIKYTNEKLTIGQWAGSNLNNYIFQGNIDEVKVHNRTLSNDEIKSIYTLSKK